MFEKKICVLTGSKWQKMEKNINWVTMDPFLSKWVVFELLGEDDDKAGCSVMPTRGWYFIILELFLDIENNFLVTNTIMK